MEKLHNHPHKRIPELNAPAGDFDALKAAVYNGADAVYLGIKFFNARRLAKNFSLEDLKKVVFFAHLHSVKIYLTLNTLVRNEELPLWFKTLEQAYLAGIDAVIIQEIFMAPYIKAFFPNLRVHASTQASLMNYHGINAIPNLDLVVLARELSEQEIRIIRKNTRTELEVFVHGHQCISYSGQCLISSLIGRRSGNRGICASSCRKKYSDITGSAGYLISTKDLMLANHLKAIAELGINTIKIEGRMKSPEYVGITTRMYRQQLDSLDPQTSKQCKPLSEQDIANLKRGFNRDFTLGFFMGNKTIVGREMPMNRGIPLGTIRNNQLILENDLRLLDGVGFWHPANKGKLEGFILRAMKRTNTNESITSAKKSDSITIPSRHFINGSTVFLTSINKGNDLLGRQKYVLFELSISGKMNEPLKIRFKDTKEKTPSEIVPEIISEIVLQKASTLPLTKEQLNEELKKSAAWGIKWIIKEYSVDDNVFMPKSILTKLRRALEEHLRKVVVHERKVSSKVSSIALPEFKESIPQVQPQLIAKVYSLDQLREANAAGVYAIYYDIFRNDLKEAKKLCTQTKFFLDTPVVMTDADIQRMEQIIAAVKPDGITVGNWGLLNTRFKGEKHGKYSLNIFNDIAVEALCKRNILPTISVELNAKQVIAMKNKQFIYYTHGNIPVMHFKGAFKEKALTDEKEYTFKLRVVNNNTEMLYSRPLATFENIKELIRGGVRYFLLDIQRDTTTTITAYKNIIAGIPQEISMLKKGTTLGNYSKGVA